MAQHQIVEVNNGWLINISLNVTCSRHDIHENSNHSLTHSFQKKG